MIVVSGFHRSGTSFMMRGLTKGGLVPIAEINNSSDANPNGIYEPIGIGQNPDWRMDETQGDCIKIVVPFILRVTKPCTIIFMVRDFDEIITSVSKLNGEEGKERKVAKWAYHCLLNIVQKYLSDKKVIYVDYNKVMENPKKELEKIKHLVPYFDKLVDSVDPKLYRNKKEEICDSSKK